MKRDFTEATKTEFINLVQEANESEWLKKKNPLDNVDDLLTFDVQFPWNTLEAYYRKMIDKNDMTVGKINKIWENVQILDSTYQARFLALEDISSLLFSKGIDKVMFPEYSTILQMIANVQSNRENNAKIDRNITGIQLGNYLESLYMSGNIVYEDKGEIFLKNNTIDDVKLNVSIHLYNKSHSDITIEQLVAGLDEKNSNEVKVLDEYTKWFKSPDDVGMAGKSKVEEYLGDLRSIMQNYANEHPEIKLTNLESLSEEQLRELIKKKENSWYVIKDSIMED